MDQSNNSGRYYVTSGRVAPQAPLKLVVYGLPGAALLAAIYSVVVRYNPFIYFSCIATLIFGVGLGTVATLACDRGRSRSAYFNAFAALVVAAMGLWLHWVIWTALVYDHGLATAKTLASSGPSGWLDFLSFTAENRQMSIGRLGRAHADTSAGFMYGVWAIEAFLIAAVAVVVVSDGKTPFSEKTRNWSRTDWEGEIPAPTEDAPDAVWIASRAWVEAGIRKFNEFLALPEVAKTLKMLRIDNPYKYFANGIRKLLGEVNVAKLTAVMDSCIAGLARLLDMVVRWGNAAMQTRAAQLLKDVKAVRAKADTALAEVVKPLQDWLNRLAQRLEVEERLSYKASTNALNPHNFRRLANEDELAAFEKELPGWVDRTESIAHQAARRPPKKVGWPDISALAEQPLKNAFKTFERGTVKPVTLSPGTTVYRVVDPKSADNSVCWMSKFEFGRLNSKADWRRRFAVWASWNGNGEYTKYVVPPGPGINVWEGVAASQQIRKTTYVLEGGATQLVIDPSHLDPAFLSKREFTGWGYDDLGRKVDLIGAPILQNNVYK